MLAARAGGAVDLHLNVLGSNVDLDVVGQLGHDLERGEARLAAGVRVKGGNAHQTVDAVLTLEIAVGVLALDHDRRALDAGLFAVDIVHHLELEAVLVRPLHIHTVEHLRPVLRLGAARAGVEGQNGVAVIVLTGEQRREADLLDPLLQIGEALLQLGQQAGVVHLVAHVDEGEQVVARGDELFKAVDLILQLLGAHLIGLRALDVVPEAVLMRLGLEPRDLVLGGFDVKRLLKVFKRVAHGEQFLLIGIVFDNSHGDLLFSYCISRKSISYRRAKGKKNPPRRRIFPIFYRQRCKLPHKNKKSTHPCVVPFWSLSAR